MTSDETTFFALTPTVVRLSHEELTFCSVQKLSCSLRRDEGHHLVDPPLTIFKKGVFDFSIFLEVFKTQKDCSHIIPRRSIRYPMNSGFFTRVY